MRPEEFSKALGAINESYLQEAEQYQKRPKKQIVRWAAAAVFVIACSAFAAAVGTQAVQYRTAAVFFVDNGMSTEGLSRKDVIRIYRDIASGRFEYADTMQLLAESDSYREAYAFFIENEMTTENLSCSDMIQIYRDITTQHFSHEKTAYVLKEAEQYRTAKSFFAANELSAENLSRSDLVRIYQDITTNTFEYDDTAQLILQSVAKRVDGFEIKGDFYSKEELKNLWNLYGSWPGLYDRNVEAKEGITYKVDNLYPEEGVSDCRRGVIRKYIHGELAWELEIPEFFVDYNYWKVENEYICIYAPLWTNGCSKFALIDPNGNILFTREFLDDTQNEWIHGVTIAENSLVLITYAKDRQSLGFYEFDFGGNLVKHTENKFEGRAGFNRVVRVSDGYLIWSGVDTINRKNKHIVIAKLDQNGKLMIVKEYSTDEFHYSFRNMIEYEGRIYISVVQIPIDQNLFGGEDSLYQQILELERLPDTNSLAPTALLKEYYDATLLVCDAKTLELETFYTVDGALGSRLLINADGELEWYVEKISVIYLPQQFINVYRLLGTLDLLQYKFDAASAFIGYEDTGTDVLFAE